MSEPILFTKVSACCGLPIKKRLCTGCGEKCKVAILVGDGSKK